MGPHARSVAPPFSSFGWSLTGALLIALSLPPVGFFPLAWVGLVPLLVRWSGSTPSMGYARELYAILLTTSCCVGFWLLFNPDPTTAALGGVSLFVVPIPLTAAFVLSGIVRERYGHRLGLVALAANVLAFEFLLLRTSVAAPWLLLGHTQVEAVDFIQTADLGGVPLLSAWVLLLNVTAYLALPTSKKSGERYGERGVAIATFTALVVLPVAYGAVRTAQSDVPAAYTRLGIVQPGVPPATWDEQSAATKVDYLADLSDGLLRRWQGDGLDSSAARLQSASADTDLGLILWPQSSLPYAGTSQREQEMLARLQQWCERRHVSLLAGARTVVGTEVDPSARLSGDDLANSAVLIRPGKPITRYDQMRRVPFADSRSATGNSRVLFGAGSTQIASTVGFESLFGDHVRRFTKDGANLIVVLSRNDLWGRSAGLYQHMLFTRLRAIETRRSVVLSTVGGVSALIQPSGAIEEVAGWMEQDAASLDVPTYRGETFYVRHGDWLGWGALVFAVGYHLLLAILDALVPELFRKKTVRPRAAFA